MVRFNPRFFAAAHPSSPRVLAQRTAGMTTAMSRRLDPRVSQTEGSEDFESLSFTEMAGTLLSMHGVSVEDCPLSSLVARAMVTSTPQMRQAGGDFRSIMSEVVSKRLRSAYDDLQPSYLQWARRAQDAPSFQELHVAQLSSAPDLLPLGEFGEIRAGNLESGAGEVYAVATYARSLHLSRVAVVNDDLRAFARIIEMAAGAARRLENRLVYAQLLGNVPLADGAPLFSAAHGNVDSGPGSALQTASLRAARAAMRQQRGLQGEVLSIAPSFILVPSVLEGVACELTNINNTPAAFAVTADPEKSRTAGLSFLTPVVEPLLDASSATAWYLAAGGTSCDTVEYCYLRGAAAPTVLSRSGWNDGIDFRITLDFAAKAIDHRGLFRSAGA